MRVVLSLLVAVLLAAGSPMRAAPADEIDKDRSALIARVVEAYGGAAALEKMRAMRQSGHTVSRMAGGARGDLVRAFQYPDHLRVEIRYPGREPEVRLLAGAESWERNKPASEPMHAAMLLQAARLAAPLMLFEHVSTLKDHGVAGAEERLFEISLSDGLSLFLAIDPSTGLIRRSWGSVRVGDQSMQFSTTYERFRNWQGVILASHERQQVNGQDIAETTIGDVSFSLPQDPSIFRP